MEINIPSSTEDLTLAQYQFLMGTLNTNKERGEYIVKEICKKDIALFEENTLISIYSTMMKLIERSNVKKDLTEVEGLKLPSNLLNIRVGHFIEIVNANPHKISLENSEIVAGCLFRKDWDKPYSADEILETAYKFRDMELTYAIVALNTMGELIAKLKDTYPLLYDAQIDEEAEISEEEDEGRKLYDMLMGLADRDFTKWNTAKDGFLGDAFVYLEEMKRDAIKQKLNEKQRGR